jgi:hypothetical protein
MEAHPKTNASLTPLKNAVASKSLSKYDVCGAG